MALHAVDDLADALTATREFLFPFEWGRWLRLALLSLFVAGGSGGGAPPNGAQFTTEAPTFGPGPDVPMGQFQQLIEQNLGLIIGLIAFGVLLALVVAWVAAVFEFALLQSLRSEEVRVRRYFSAYRGAGTRLFAFRLLFGLGLAVIFGGVALLVIGPVVLGATPQFLLVLVALAPVFFVVGVIAAIVYVFTTAFVAPIMLLEDRGVLSAWGRFWGVFKAEWEQFLVFLLVGLFVMIVFGILLGIATAILTVVVAIPFGIVFFFVFMGTGSVFNPIWAVLLGVPFLLLVLLVGAFVQVPVQTYLRYWALLILGDVDSNLDLIPEQRTEIRGGEVD